MWKGHSAKDPILQGLQCSWSVGNTLAPFIISPFLTPVKEALWPKYLNQSHTGNETWTVTNNGTTTNSSHVDWTMYDDEMYLEIVSNVRYAYLVIGVPVILMVPVYIGISCHTKKQQQKPKEKESMTNSKIKLALHEESRCFRYGLLFQLYIFAFTCAIIINIADGYYSLFVVENLNWSVKQGALITSMFMGAKAVGRFLGIPLSCYFSSRCLLYINVSMCFAGHFLMLFNHYIGDVGMYLAVVTAGFGLSNINANLILWVSSNLHVTTGVSATFFTGLSSGFILGYFTVGTLMQYMGNIWLIYALMASSVVQVILFAIMQVYIHFGRTWGPEVIMETEVQDGMLEKEDIVTDSMLQKGNIMSDKDEIVREELLNKHNRMHSEKADIIDI